MNILLYFNYIYRTKYYLYYEKNSILFYDSSCIRRY